MKDQLRHIAILVTISILFSACAGELDAPANGKETPGENDKLQVELFTRASEFSTPVTRVGANEAYFGKTPWVFVFKGSDNDATFVEAERAYLFTDNTKTYVNLTRCSDPCQLLIVANPQNLFYIYDGSNSQYDSYPTDIDSKEDIEGALKDKSLGEVCELLYTLPLNDPQTYVPYANGATIPMSCLYTAQYGIDTGTTIEADLQRIVAKMIVNNTASNFTLNGVVSVHNVPQYGLIHNLSADTPPTGMELIRYKPGSGNISDALNESTESNPIYVFESNAANETYIIVEGTYGSDATESYYKMKVINSNKTVLNLLRNNQYTFTITSVGSRGYDSWADAFASKALNIDLSYDIEVFDPSSHEIIANNDYYLAVSNSVFIAYAYGYDNYDSYYNQNVSFEAFTLFTNCTRNFTDGNLISFNGSNIWLNCWNKIPNSTSSSTYATSTITVVIQPWFLLTNSDNPVYITLKLGNLEKKVHIRQRESIPAIGATLRYAPSSTGSNDGAYDWSTYPPQNTDLVSYYCLSGYVEYPEDTDWITLSSTSGATGNSITVNDGEILINIAQNNGDGRTGIVYLTTTKHPYDPTYDSNSVKRIKISIAQRANIVN